ncbi:MAG: DmsE family decaheme c-type cytochrome [Desulfobacterales bacterium]|nr:DmsE family decaheme c-type cytochrome [Desulfobacterales bacterium]
MEKVNIKTPLERLSIMALLVILTGFFLPGSSAAQAPEEFPEDRGKIVFNKYGCFVCHGNEGSGGVKNRNSLAGGKVTALTFISRAFGEAALIEKIVSGSFEVLKADPAGSIPPLSMPGVYRAMMTKAELSDLAAYLKSLAPEEGEQPKPPSPVRPPVPDFMLSSNNCQVCHGALTEHFKSNPHYGAHLTQKGPSAKIVCATCHGDGREHAAGYGNPEKILRFAKDSPATAGEKNAACLQCHERGQRRYWKGSEHESRNMACVDCHKVMEPVSARRLFNKVNELETCFQCHQQRRAQIQRSSHMPYREGKLKCSDCHNPHGTANPKLLKEATVNENCYKCHAEKRGPFLWEHAPVVENCLNCHEPHGSNHDKLLKMMQPRLCQSCHVTANHPTTPQLPTSRFVFNRSCGNCHSQIHGSNSPSGVRWHR